MSYTDRGRLEVYAPFRTRVRLAVEDVVAGITNGTRAIPTGTVTLNQLGALEGAIAANNDLFLDQYLAAVIANPAVGAAIIDPPPSNKPEDDYSTAISDEMIAAIVFPTHLQLASRFPA
jgi:hypothetical protein